MNKAPCQRLHGLRFEPGTAANRTGFKAQGNADRSQHGGFGMTPAFVSAPFVRSVWPCALNTVPFAAVPGAKRNPCKRWQGALFIGVLT